MARPDKNDGALISWREKVALAQVYKERQPFVNKRTDEERENEWEKIDKYIANQIMINVKSSLSLKKKDGPLKEQEVKSYEPPHFRLLLSNDLQKHNVHFDKGISLGSDNYNISVFCDIPSQCTDFFLSDQFHYRLGRPFRLGIEFDDNASVPNTVSDIHDVPPNLRLFAHSKEGTCICSCNDCTKDPDCECKLLAKLVNNKKRTLTNGKFEYKGKTEINCEEAKSLLIGCGQACKCYKHKKCDMNIDRLFSKQPKLEIYRKDTEMNFRVRTLQTLQPGDFIAEFTGHIETREELGNHPKAYDYAFQLVFKDSGEFLSDGIRNKLGDHRIFETLEQDLANFKKHSKHKFKELFIQPYDFGSVAQFIAHGCLPNCLIVRAVANHVFPQFHRLLLFANHVIPAGSELFINYGGDYIQRFQGNCRCDTLLCRAVDNRGLANYDSVREYLKNVAFPCVRLAATMREKEINLTRKLDCKVAKGEHEVLAKGSGPDIPQIQLESAERAEANKSIYDSIKERIKEFKEQAAIDIGSFRNSELRREQDWRNTKDKSRQKKLSIESDDIVEIYSSLRDSSLVPEVQQRTSGKKELRALPPMSYEEWYTSPVAKDKERTQRKRKCDVSNKSKSKRGSKEAEDNEEIPTASSQESSTNANNSDDIIWLDDDPESDTMADYVPDGSGEEEIQSQSDDGHDVKLVVKKSKKKAKIAKSKREDEAVTHSTTSAVTCKERLEKQRKTYESILPSGTGGDLPEFRIPRRREQEEDKTPSSERQMNKETSTPAHPHRKISQHLEQDLPNNHYNRQGARSFGYDSQSSSYQNSNYYNADNYDEDGYDFSPQYSPTSCRFSQSPQYSPASCRFSPEPAILQSDVNYEVVSMDISNTSLCDDGCQEPPPQNDVISPPDKKIVINIKLENLHQRDMIDSDGGSSTFSVSKIPLPEGPPPPYADFSMIAEVDELETDDRTVLINEEGEQAEQDFNARLEEQREADELARLKIMKKQRKKEKKRHKKSRNEKSHYKKRHRSPSSERSVRSLAEDSQPSSSPLEIIAEIIRTEREGSSSSIEWM